MVTKKIKQMKSNIRQLALSFVFVTGVSLSIATAEETQAELKAQAKITKEEATKTALAKVPHGEIQDSELEKERGILIWSFDISMPKSTSITEIQVDAKTGKIVSTQVETPKEQAKETADDKKAKEAAEMKAKEAADKKKRK